MIWHEGRGYGISPNHPGSMGAGKTRVLAEASDILTMHDITHAAVDLDALGLAHLPPAVVRDGLMYRNLQSFCKNYVSVGIMRVLLARAMEDRAELELCRGIVAAPYTVVCRLTASIEAMEERAKSRESGLLQRKYVSRVAKLNAVLDDARLEDFTVINENRSLTEVAQEMLIKAGWVSSECIYLHFAKLDSSRIIENCSRPSDAAVAHSFRCEALPPVAVQTGRDER